MLNQLSYSVTFPTTGRTLGGEFEFQPGFGVITGANEQGKSLIIEVVRWCLFGSAALRGKAEDYKTLKATLEFSARGQSYVVDRTYTTAKLMQGDAVLCTGTTPVNKHIPALLGFGLDVFDVACAANQGDIERLGNLRPAERKKMVDTVIGLDRLEEIAKWAGEEARGFEKQVEAIERSAGPEPVKPLEEFDPSALAAARAAHEELHRLHGVTSVRPPQPCRPAEVPPPNLKDLVEAERANKIELEVLRKQLLALPQPSPYSDEQLRDIELWQRKQQFERPQYPAEALERFALDWSTLGQREALERLVHELEQHGEVDCPNCQHQFYLENDRLEELRHKLARLPVLDRPPLSEREIKKQLDFYDPETLAEWEDLKDVAAADFLDQRAIDQARRANAAAARRAEIEARMAELGEPTDRYEVLQDWQRYQEWERALARIAELEPLAARFERLMELRNEWTRYHERRELWERAREEMALAQAQGDGWRRAQRALTILRGLVKGHLVPALSRVASHLLARMTGGQRSAVVVDQDFDVTVDGQALSTLSGSGKAVANLALRLGLGQVLTNNVLSLFVGDEIDASMDDMRAKNLGDCVHSLVGKISQIIHITHKSGVDADWSLSV
jgi:DNA repair exonuclease SbcCD ATPase subunit